MPRRRKAAEGSPRSGNREAAPLPLEARDLSTADPYEAITRPERSRTRQRSRRLSDPQAHNRPPVQQAPEQDRFRAKTRRRVDGAGVAAVDADARIRHLSHRTISPVRDDARVPLVGPLDAHGRHPSLRKLSQVVLDGDEHGSRGGTNPSQYTAPSSERTGSHRVRVGRRSGGAAALKKPRSSSPPQAGNPYPNPKPNPIPQPRPQPQPYLQPQPIPDPNPNPNPNPNKELPATGAPRHIPVAWGRARLPRYACSALREARRSRSAKPQP